MTRTEFNWNIGNVAIEGQAVLAPMAGVCDTAYRLLAMEERASLLCTEMVSAMGIKYNNERTKDLLFLEKEEHPVALQIFGSDVKAMARAATVVEAKGADIVDINMGCPVKKVVSSGDGSALMKTPDLAVEIAAEVVKAVSIPVTVKLRTGWDAENRNVVEIAKRMEAVGVSAITVHGRTREQMYSGHADWSYIKAVKEALTIPVIGNGDVVDAISAKRMLDETGCDAVSIGRAAQGNPWIFKQVRVYLEEGVLLPMPTLVEKMDMLRRHFLLLVKYKGENAAVREIRTHAGWYTKGLPASAEWRNRFNLAKTKDHFLEEIDAFVDNSSKITI